MGLEDDALDRLVELRAVQKAAAEQQSAVAQSRHLWVREVKRSASEYASAARRHRVPASGREWGLLGGSHWIVLVPFGWSSRDGDWRSQPVAIGRSGAARSLKHTHRNNRFWLEPLRQPDEIAAPPEVVREAFTQRLAEEIARHNSR